MTKAPGLWRPCLYRSTFRKTKQAILRALTAPVEMLAPRVAYIVTITAITSLGCGLLIIRRDASKALRQIIKDSERSSTVQTIKRPEAAQQASQLIAAYEKMGHDFAAQGLDSGAITALQPWFHGIHSDEIVWPKRYDQMDPPFPHDSVRILVVPLTCCPPISAAVAAIASRIATLLPEGVKVFANARAQYHITVFHSSHPVDTRPDPLQADGGVGSLTEPPHQRGPVRQEVLQREAERIKQVVWAAKPPELETVSIVMARPGTLLLTWIDRSGHVTDLRHSLKAAFPGATSKQSNIIHSTLFRIVMPDRLDEATVAAISQACADATESIRGKVCVPDQLWWIRETEFSTVIGPREVYMYGPQKS